MDQGSHLYDWSIPRDLCEQGYIEHTDFGYLHFCNKPYSAFIEAAKLKLSGRVDINNIEALKKYEGNGQHLVTNLLLSEPEYYDKIKNSATCLVDISHGFRIHGIDYPFVLEYP